MCSVPMCSNVFSFSLFLCYVSLDRNNASHMRATRDTDGPLCTTPLARIFVSMAIL